MAGREPVGIASARPGLAASAAVALAYGVVLLGLVSVRTALTVTAGGLLIALVVTFLPALRRRRAISMESRRTSAQSTDQMP